MMIGWHDQCTAECVIHVPNPSPSALFPVSPPNPLHQHVQPSPNPKLKPKSSQNPICTTNIIQQAQNPKHNKNPKSVIQIILTPGLLASKANSRYIMVRVLVNSSTSLRKQKEN
jgi:hypothetical protein